MIAPLLFMLLAEPQGRAAAPPQTGSVQTAAPADLRVVLATPVYEPDGTVRSETTMLSGGTSLVYLFGRQSLCEIASVTVEPKDARVGWRVTAQTISQSATELIVSIDWRRMWDRGKKISDGPAATQQLVLHPGDNIPLDHIPNLLATSACRAVGLGLEVRTARPASAPPPAPQNADLPLGAKEGGTKPLNAEIWLVHNKPAGTDDVLHQTVRVATSGGTFAFSPVKLPTPDGDIAVELTGAFRRYQDPTGTDYLLLSMTRVISGGSVPPGGLRQVTSAPLALPGPAEVLSFDMPGGQLRSGGAGGAQRGGGGAGAVAGGVVVPGGAVARIVGGGGGGGQGGGRGGAVTARGTEVARSAAIAQALSVIAAHGFELRVRLTPIQ